MVQYIRGGRHVHCLFCLYTICSRFVYHLFAFYVPFVRCLYTACIPYISRFSEVTHTDIVYQDKRIVVAVKPSGVLSTDVPGGMPSLLRQGLGTDCIRTVHRLDAPVSGLMVFARSARAASELSRQIRDGIFEKSYLAVLRGTQILPSAELFDLLARDKEKRFTHVVNTQEKGVQEARLHYEALAERDGMTLVRIQLLTGRTHQIRVQFSSRGLPLAGDKRYGVPNDPISPIALWSAHLAFRHPETNEPLTFDRQPPAIPPWDIFGI